MNPKLVRYRLSYSYITNCGYLDHYLKYVWESVSCECYHCDHLGTIVLKGKNNPAFHTFRVHYTTTIEEKTPIDQLPF